MLAKMLGKIYSGIELIYYCNKAKENAESFILLTLAR